MICGNCNKEIDYKRETVSFHLDAKCVGSKEFTIVVDGVEFTVKLDTVKLEEKNKKWVAYFTSLRSTARSATGQA